MSNYDGRLNTEIENSNWSMAFNLVKKGSRVLDIGCSNGNFGESLRYKKKCTVDGIEPDEEDARLAQSKLDRVFVGTDNRVLNGALVDEKYDHVIFLDVIEHLTNPVATLEEVKHHLRPKGSVIFSLPNMAHISTRIMLMSGNFKYGKTGLLDNTHLHFYTKKEIERIFSEAGYILKELKGMIVPYDQKLASQELQKIGVDKPSDNLFSVLNGNNGDVFQYVGLAEPSSKPIVIQERDFSSPNPKKVIADWQGERDATILALQKEIHDIYTSKSWRTIRALRRLLP